MFVSGVPALPRALHRLGADKVFAPLGHHPPNGRYSAC